MELFRQRLRVALPPALLLLVSAAFFGRFWDRTIVFRDALNFFAPNKFLTLKALGGLSLPEWNPGQFLGMPFVADPQVGFFYPFNLLFLVFSFGVAHRLYLLLHYPLAAGAMYLFLKGRGVRSESAWAGAAAFALSGFLVSQHGPVRMLLGAAWAPLVFYFLGQALAGRTKMVLAAAAALAMQLLAGDPETALVTGGLAAGWSLTAEARRGRPARGAALTAGLAGATFLLAAGQILPAWQMMSLSERSGGLPLKDALVFSFHPAALAEFIWPTPFGRIWPDYFYWGRFTLDNPELRAPWSYSNYLGLPALGLAGYGLWRMRGLKRWLPAAGIIFFLLMAFGRYAPFYAWVHAVTPVFNAFRYPSKLVVWVTGILAVAAALGLEELSARGKDEPREYLRLALALTLVTMALAPAGALIWPRVFAAHNPFASDPLRTASALAHLWAGASQVTAVGLGAAAALFLAGKGRVSGRAAAWLLVLIIIADLWWANVRLMPHGPGDIYETPSRAGRAIAAVDLPTPGRYRIFREEIEFRDRDRSGTDRTFADRQVRFAFNTLKRNLDNLAGFEDVVAYGSYEMASGRGLFDRPLTLPLLAAFNVRYIVSPGGAGAYPGATDIYSDPAGDFKIRRLDQSRPRAFWAGTARFASSDDEALRLLEGADHGAEVVITGPAGNRFPNPAPTPIVPAVVVGYLSDQVTVEVDAPEDGWLALLDRWYPGWTATVDGSPADISRAEVVCRAVRVSAGKHQIRFEFRQPWLRTGMAVSAIAWLLVGAVLLTERRSRLMRTP